MTADSGRHGIRPAEIRASLHVVRNRQASQDFVSNLGQTRLHWHIAVPGTLEDADMLNLKLPQLLDSEIGFDDSNQIFQRSIEIESHVVVKILLQQILI